MNTSTVRKRQPNKQNPYFLVYRQYPGSSEDIKQHGRATAPYIMAVLSIFLRWWQGVAIQAISPSATPPLRDSPESTDHDLHELFGTV